MVTGNFKDKHSYIPQNDGLPPELLSLKKGTLQDQTRMKTLPDRQR